MDKSDSATSGFVGQVAQAIRYVTTPIAAVSGFAIVLFGMLWLVCNTSFDSVAKVWIIGSILALFGLVILGFFLLCAYAPHILTFDKDAHLQKIAIEGDPETVGQLPRFLGDLSSSRDGAFLEEVIARGLRTLEQSGEMKRTSPSPQNDALTSSLERSQPTNEPQVAPEQNGSTPAVTNA